VILYTSIVLVLTHFGYECACAKLIIVPTVLHKTQIISSNFVKHMPPRKMLQTKVADLNEACILCRHKFLVRWTVPEKTYKELSLCWVRILEDRSGTKIKFTWQILV